MGITQIVGNSADGGLTDVAQPGKQVMREPLCQSLTNSDDLSWGQLRVVMALMSLLILQVLCVRAPVQVIQMIVRSVTISVAGLFSWWARPNKRFKDEVMDITHRVSTAHPHNLTGISWSNLVQSWSQLVPLICDAPTVFDAAPDGTVIANAVARKVCNIFISYHVSIVSCYREKSNVFASHGVAYV
jgi:hypothetical protein